MTLRPLKFIVQIMLFLSLAAASQAAELFDVSTLGEPQRLTSFERALVADRAAISMEVPGSNGKLTMIDLDAAGDGPQFFWSFYALKNAGPVPKDVVLTIAHRGFASSGLFQPSRTGSLVLRTGSTLPGNKLGLFNGPREDVIAIHLEPNQSVTAALQGVEPLPIAEVWLQTAYEERQSRLSGFHGALIGIAGFLTLGIALLTIFRNSWFAGAALCLAIPLFLFICQELGFTQSAFARVSSWPADRDQLRAIVESLLCAGFAIALIGMSGTDRETPVQRAALWSLVAAACANIILLFVNPALATGFARIGLGFLAIEGLFIILRANRTGYAARHAMPFWIALSAWTIFAAFVLFVKIQLPVWTMALLLSICVLLAYLGFVVLENLFVDADAYDEDASTDAAGFDRSSLALASARHYLWEWAPAANEMETATEFWTSLGLDASLAQSLTPETFLSHVHPDDLGELSEKSASLASGAVKTLEHDLRIKDVEGRYRWFALRSRAHVEEGTENIVCVGTLTDITKTKELEVRLQQDAVRDPVTGLPSRALFLDRLQRSLASRTGAPVRVLIIDLDRFRILNEGYGADAGDQLLLVTAKRIEERLGAEDSATRLTGSQFAIAYAELSKGEGELAFATAVMSAITAPITLTNGEVVLSISAGLSQRGLPGVAADELIAQATGALLSAKSRGTGQLVVYDIGMRNDRVTQVAIESGLRQAIARGEIEVYFQPIHSLVTGAIAGFEALARWRHPQLGLIAPEQFINAAEEAGMIGELGQIVLSESARHLGIWQRTVARNRNLFVAVNVSATQLLDDDFANLVERILVREGIALGSLKVEVTEAVVTRHRERVLALFAQLRALGVGLSCDDFGTGYSTLSTLRDLPFDTLKLDRSFVTHQQDDGRAAHVIRSVLDLAHGLAMSVVCEGIETEDQAERLRDLGCDYGQGFHFGPAIHARNVEPLLNGQTLKAFESSEAPPPGAAPLAPRLPLPLPIDAAINGPEVLPSLFNVAKGGKKSTRKKAAKKSAKNKKRRQA